MRSEYGLMQREAIATVAKELFGRAISFDEQERLIDAVEQPLTTLASHPTDAPDTIECPTCHGDGIECTMMEEGIKTDITCPNPDCKGTGRVPKPKPVIRLNPSHRM